MQTLSEILAGGTIIVTRSTTTPYEQIKIHFTCPVSMANEVNAIAPPDNIAWTEEYIASEFSNEVIVVTTPGWRREKGLGVVSRHEGALACRSSPL